MPLSIPDVDLNVLAQNQAQTKYGGAINQLQRNLQTQGITDDSAIAAIQGWGQTGGGIIDQAYGALNNYLTQNAGNQQGVFDRGLQSVANNYAQAQQFSEANKQDAMNLLQNIAGGVGVSGERLAGSAQTSNLLNAITGMQNQMAQSGAASQSELRQWALNHLAGLNQGITAGQQEAVQRKDAFANNISNLLGQAEFTKSKNQFDLQGRLADLFGEQGSFTIDALQDLVAQRFQQQVQSAQLDQAAQELAARIEMNNADLADRAAGRTFQAQQAAKSDELDWAKFLYGMGQDQFGNQLAQDQFGFEKEKFYTGLNKPTDNTYSGSGGLQAYLRDHPGASNLLASLATTSYNTGMQAGSDPTKDPYVEAINKMREQMGETQNMGLVSPGSLDMSEGQRYLDILFGRYGGRNQG